MGVFILLFTNIHLYGIFLGSAIKSGALLSLVAAVARAESPFPDSI